MSNIVGGQRAATSYIRSLGLAVDYHIGASVANIVSGHRSIHAHDDCVRDTVKYLKVEGVALEDEQVELLVNATRAAM